MSYQLQFTSVAAPEADLDVFPFLNKLRQDAGGQPPSAMLKRFHDALAGLFPDAPWSEGHYAGDVGHLTLVRRRKEVVPHVLYIAAELGLTVVDNQSGEVHRPPTYQVVLEGAADGVALGEAAQKLAALMRKPVTEMIALLSGGRRTVVKKGVPLFQARQYASVLRDRGACRASLAIEPGPAPLSEPPKPLPPPAMVAAAPMSPKLALDPVPAATTMPPMSRPFESEPPVEAADANESLYLVADGLRLTIFATVLYMIAAYFIGSMDGWPTSAMAVGVTLLAMVAVYRLAKGVGSNIIMRVLAVLLMLIPLVNIIVLVLMIVRGRKTLAQHDVELGLLGASHHDTCRLAGSDMVFLASTKLAWLAAFGLLGCVTLGRAAVERQVTAMLGTHPQPCALVGIWTSSRIGPNGLIVLREDGKYMVAPVQGAEARIRPQYGEWSVKERVVTWIDGEHSPALVDATRMNFRVDGKSFSVTERNGTTTQFRRVRGTAKGRCAVN